MASRKSSFWRWGRVVLVCLATTGLWHRPAGAQARYWNQYRGPDGNGWAGEARLPVEWSEQKNIRWKTFIRGKAWSSPVVWENEIWMTSATEDGKELYAICVDASTGRILQDITVFRIAQPMYCYPFNSYASPTPVIEHGRLWVHYGSAGTACLDTRTGKVLWSRQDLPCDHYRGPGSSPIVFGDLLFVNFDGFDVQYVVALDKHTGRTVWRQDRSLDYGTDNGDLKKAYSTPAVFEHRGRWQLVSPAAVGTIAYDPYTGRELWKVYHGGFNAAVRPIYTHGLVLITTERGLKLLAVRPDGEGDVTQSHVVWSNQKQVPSRSSPIVVGDYMYMVSDIGVASCLDVRTGETMWAERLGGKYSASPIYASGYIYFFDEEQKTYVIRATPERLERVAVNELENGCMASPAVLGDALLVRTKTHLYRIESTGAGQSGS